ncbi:hypothetical protein A3H38_04595 [candidate division WOR-1 bacterium RIFCSPLOWO2_02_FULL_46_20]|uniref:Uncharacterized protein TP-0789 domain-containing protein n=2 Tax=Saganbacteria TaxID=1703751 RepID=A0A1F4R442_UNCSA|nr:MAG: hypothetical protein A3J44_03520 [candidate division WOR-1 bacterium RIFCSPHIGHO2_02_FULL_45_12]OGC03001.1 MAG: hypothetical protein A3H38_04595 [candidate division WOR-1 bacterium RIFCSPLOWO2_02_FULL_46_20]OGC10047.1 MAG: hypothetical protein A3F86_02335 [candidate division WOR-1 bacterium RIFCSPLOWO2_12_FULL_45_9]
MKKMCKLVSVIFVCLMLSASFVAAEEALTLEILLSKVQANQLKVIDMYAETTTKITSNLQLTTDNKTGSQTMTQKAKMWTKGTDKSKIEMISPTKQITITNGDQMAIINPETGQKVIQDLSKTKNPLGGNQSDQMNLQKAMEYFNLSLKKADAYYIITGVPKKENKFMGKMEFYIDSASWVPVKVLMYDAKNKLISQSTMEYKKIEIGKDSIWQLAKSVSNVNTPMGAMKVEMGFENIKVNEGVSDKEFEVK